ncbi:MAG: hypothetical protein AB1413_10290 [Thermodesulfobacteriota bacterium]
MSTTGQRPDPARFLRETEQQAREHQLEPVRLVNGADTLLGLALLVPNLPAEIAREMLAQASCLLTTRDETPACGLAPASEQGELLALLQAEIERHRESRLPCSLLLLGLANANPKIKGKTPARTRCQVITAIDPLLDHQDAAMPCDETTIAVLLPATSLGKARRRAAAIQAALASGPHLLCCGLSVCHAHEPLSAEEFLQRARQELERATALGNGALCHAALTTVDDSCQVTVEEREQLFSFLA